MPGINFNNKKEVEWADLSLAISGATVSKARGLTVALELDLEELFAAGNKAFSLQAGNQTASGSLKLLKGAVDDLWTASVAAGAPNPLFVEFDITATFKKYGTRGTWTCTILGARISKVEYSMMQGDKFMEIELPFKALDVKIAQV